MKITIHEDEFQLLMEQGVAAALEAKRLSEKYGKDFFECDDLIKILGVGRDNVRGLMRSKNFPVKTIGGRKVVSAAAFVAWACALDEKQ
ncbi:MAG: hypothetical protein LBT21_03910 [Oscillospiraceae bacterium]|jgi:hypothetical protein|nr:hypothetical protein [Oscillospiraceae bacterium]